MAPTSFVILHGGSVLEITLIEYLFRLVLYLFVFGGIAIIVFWGLEVVSVISSEVVKKWSGAKNDP
ncbi:hypothetical protein [Haladaptatus pallidirubidus]|uniref:Uncharacterized protein n=1 Tax=Haladaptatus pallidirubidus TaxID=1008152 RepID=A0AAV3UK09_9EURY|nr:hypothetical protein [Haladaptatus pallidirubidus]